MKTITIIARRWFERTNGNTYHSCTALVDGESVGVVNFTYGYGSHYLQTGTKILEKAGFLKDSETYENGSHESLWRYCDRKNITFYETVSDVSRKKDLAF